LKTLDLRKQYQNLYKPPAKKLQLIDVPELQFARIDGRIGKGESPSTSRAFQDALGALFGVSYTLKFMSKKRAKNAIDYPVMALEALWWVDDGRFDIARPGNWHWRAMILQPDHVDARMFAAALETLREKHPSPALDALRLERDREGLCVQAMHVGPYSTEPETVARMQAFAAESGHVERFQNGKRILAHHEIYLGDPRRCAPEKLKTVLRHPVTKAG
jgi:hypothetical protein